MRVVHLVHFFQPGYVGGIQRYVAQLAHLQYEAGIDVSVFTIELPVSRKNGRRLPVSQRNGPRDVEGAARRGPWSAEAKTGSANGSVPVHARRSWGTVLRTPLYPPLLYDVSRLHADIVHVHGPSPWFDVALMVSQPRAGSIVLTLHNTFPRTSLAQRVAGRLGKSALRRTMSRSDVVIASHAEFAAELLGRESLDALNGRLRFVPPGVDHSLFRRTGPTRDPRLLVFVAHVRPEKGLHVLVDAVALLPDVRLEVYATVSYERKYYERVRSMAMARLGERVRFVVDPPLHQLVDAYNRAGCVVVPSLGLESWNLVLLEAAACGAACVRTDLPGLKWADFALEVAPGSPARLAEGIAAALERRAELGERASDAARRYSWSRTHQETLAAYQLAQR
jgi:glycosyltransferase involved in cell wall biosynthesis